MNTYHRACISAVLILGISPAAYPAICDFSQNAGIVKRLYPSFSSSANISGLYFSLGGTTAALTAPTGYYFIPNYDNYMAMYNLVLEAARSQWTLKVKTTNCNNPLATANVQYLVVDL